MTLRGAVMLMFVFAGCEQKTEAVKAPVPVPAPVVVPAPAPAPAPVPAPVVDAGPPPADSISPSGGPVDPRCPAGQFFVHGGCHTGNDVGIAGPGR